MSSDSKKNLVFFDKLRILNERSFIKIQNAEN